LAKAKEAGEKSAEQNNAVSVSRSWQRGPTPEDRLLFDLT